MPAIGFILADIEERNNKMDDDKNVVRLCDRCGHDINPKKFTFLTEPNSVSPNIVEFDHTRGTYCSDDCAENDYHDLYPGRSMHIFTRYVGTMANRKINNNWYDN